jgi:DNA polymerase-3 subunit gamma/tau
VFENIIAQGAALQLMDDIRSRRLAPSMLFFGPPASGKGSAALELARVLSCESGASWNCACPACARHRYLIHGDLLILGPRSFGAEIAAAKAAFLREPASAATRALFIRSLRKLQARFSPVLLEDDPRTGKLTSGGLRALLQSLEEDIDEFEAVTAGAENRDAAAKLGDSILKDAFKLEGEGMGDVIPIAHIRRAAYWARLAPNGRRKILLIENADCMLEGARNSLLKIIEEPPETVSIILTTVRREAIMPTLLSRLRPYRFLKRDDEREKEVIRRVFRDDADGPISAYLDSFLPQPLEKLYPLAAFFIASLTRSAAVLLRKKGVDEIPAELAALGTYCGPIAGAAGFERTTSAGGTIGTVIAESGNFEARSFSRFLEAVLDLVSRIQKEGGVSPRSIAYNDIWLKHSTRAEAAAEVWHQSPALALESFFYRVREALAAL